MSLSIPEWAGEAVVGLGRVIIKLVEADNDDQREDALMQAAEIAKAALDKKKFGR